MTVRHFTHRMSSRVKRLADYFSDSTNRLAGIASGLTNPASHFPNLTSRLARSTHHLTQPAINLSTYPDSQCHTSCPLAHPTSNFNTLYHHRIIMLPNICPPLRQTHRPLCRAMYGRSEGCRGVVGW